MTDREKVIKAIDNCVHYGVCLNCEYEEHISCKTCLMSDALALLKEQDNCENCAIAIEDRQLIVRCKDCKHAEHCEIYAGWDGQHLDWFCADGEKE